MSDTFPLPTNTGQGRGWQVRFPKENQMTKYDEAIAEVAKGAKALMEKFWKENQSIPMEIALHCIGTAHRIWEECQPRDYGRQDRSATEAFDMRKTILSKIAEAAKAMTDEEITETLAGLHLERMQRSINLEQQLDDDDAVEALRRKGYSVQGPAK